MADTILLHVVHHYFKKFRNSSEKKHIIKILMKGCEEIAETYFFFFSKISAVSYLKVEILRIDFYIQICIALLYDLFLNQYQIYSFFIIVMILE